MYVTECEMFLNNTERVVYISVVNGIHLQNVQQELICPVHSVHCPHTYFKSNSYSGTSVKVLIMQIQIKLKLSGH